MPRVVVNSTPLILLAGIGRLDLLARLYGTIVIPSAVYEEVTAKEDSTSCALRSLPPWLSIEQAPDLPRNYRRLISAKLHAGELEVISLALSTGADFVVLDDNAARKTAKYLGLTVTGTLGLLLRAKERGIIEEVRPLVSELRANGFRIDDRVVEAVVRLAQES